LPIYGREPRVTVRHSGAHTDDIRVLVHSHKEIATSDGRQFIKLAVKAYERLVRKLAADVASRQPWKVNGRQWHLSQDVIPKTQPRLWRGTLIVELLGRFKKVDAEIAEDWGRKVMVVLEHPRIKGVWGRIVANHAQGLRIEVRVGRGQFTPAMVDQLGLDVAIRHVRPNEDQVQFWLQRIEQCDAGQFNRMVRGSIEHFTGSSET